MAILKVLFAAGLCSSLALADLVGVPTVPFTVTGSGSFNAFETKHIVVDSRYANSTDTNGWTLIPPTLSQFAETFANDLADFTDVSRNYLVEGDGPQDSTIFLTIDNCTEYRDAAGRWTSEAYTLEVKEDSVTISGASPLGVWWGTRTLLQQVVLNNGSMAIGSGIDSPGWNTRGIFVRICSVSQVSMLMHGLA